jgi:MFS family permease
MAAFAGVEARVENPILPLGVLRVRGLVGSSVVRGFLVTGMYSTFFLGTLYLEHVRHYSALQTGLAFLPWTLTVGMLSLGITARLVGRFGAMPVLVAGMTIVAGGLGLLTTIGPHTAFFPTFFVAYLAIGLGIGSAFMPLLSIAMTHVPEADAGLASGIVNVSQQVAGALGLAVLSTIAANRSHAVAADAGPVGALVAGDRLAFAVGALSVAVGIATALVVLRAPRRAPLAVAPAAELAATGDRTEPPAELERQAA